MGSKETGSPVPVCQCIYASYWCCPPHQPPKARSRPPLWTPPSFFCVFALPSPPRCHREHPCSSSRLLSTGTSQKSQISLQFPVQCLFGGKRAGGRATMKKEPHSQTVWAAFEGKHVQEGYVRRAVRQTEARVFWSWHTDPTSAGTQSTALFRPQPPQSNKHPPRHLLSVPGTAPSGGELRTRCRKTDHTAPEINIRLNSVITLGFFMHHSQKQDGCNTINISTKVVPNLCRLLPHPFINTTHHVLNVFFYTYFYLFFYYQTQSVSHFKGVIVTLVFPYRWTVNVEACLVTFELEANARPASPVNTTWQNDTF